ncbi:chemotaxis protein CheA [Pseudodesulfovibrio cashew]|uniref:Chemotaxis protein CheA n=1 Tax=Pseudodesulfovibrio cashew TaxID=2678688 RepID=A0A6I6JHL4_9BACT|nr:Hpt domain-containing protein [Pseudodesulfovibrio cashew]QGY40669.1 chemotaxis protein CheA [Pseudodesulfovibrio cashew]
MTQRDDVLEIYLEETLERLDSIESGLLTLEQRRECDTRLVNSIFRDAHSVKAGANLLELFTIEKLSHDLENVLERIRQCTLEPSEMVVTASLEAVDKLRELVENVEQSESISIRLHTAMLDMAVKRTLEEAGG